MAAAAQFLQNPNTSTYQWHHLTSNLSKFDKYAEMLNRTGEFDWVKNRLQQPQAYFENIGFESILLGHSRENLILSCTFDTQPCNETNFMYYPTPNFFNCYTFQTLQDWGRTTGPNAGLSMVLYLEAYDKGLAIDATYFTLSNIGNAAGVRVNIHAPNTRPSPIDQGFDIPPGFSANIGLNVNQYKRLGPPWGECIEDVVKEDKNLEDRYVYGPHDCVQSCQQVYIMDQCNCISSSLPLPNFNSSNLTYCGTWNVTTMLDLDKYLDTIMCESKEMSFFMENMTDLCDCYPACENIEHTMDVSYSFWPNQYSQPNFFKVNVLDHPDSTELRAYQHLAKYNSTELVESDLITSNFVRINVFRKTMMVKQHDEKPAYDIPQLASDLGGTFGLWIGMSLISWCEVIELMIKVFISVCHSARKNLIIGES
jgi:acid-sensing ion channel 2